MRKNVKSTVYSKGLPMTADEKSNPAKYVQRVCVAYAKNHNVEPRKYVITGVHDHINEHQIRRIFAKSTGINYFDARVILWDTYVSRVGSGNIAKIKTENI